MISFRAVQATAILRGAQNHLRQSDDAMVWSKADLRSASSDASRIELRGSSTPKFLKSAREAIEPMQAVAIESAAHVEENRANH